MWYIPVIGIACLVIGLASGFALCFFLVRARTVSTDDESEDDLSRRAEAMLKAWTDAHCDACKSADLGDKDGTEE